jgi:hypothetical protein
LNQYSTEEGRANLDLHFDEKLRSFHLMDNWWLSRNRRHLLTERNEDVVSIAQVLVHQQYIRKSVIPTKNYMADNA